MIIVLFLSLTGGRNQTLTICSQPGYLILCMNVTPFQPPLFHAIVQNDMNMVKSFLETGGIDINVLGRGLEYRGLRATNLAIIYSDGDDTGMLQEILKRNPDLEASTPIYNAFMLSKHCHFKLLHAAGAKLNSIAQVNETTGMEPDLNCSSPLRWTIVDSVCYMCRCDLCFGNGICCSFLREPCCTGSCLGPGKVRPGPRKKFFTS